MVGGTCVDGPWGFLRLKNRNLQGAMERRKNIYTVMLHVQGQDVSARGRGRKSPRASLRRVGSR